MFQAYGLYTQIRSNRIRSVLLLAGLFLLVWLMTYAGALFASALGSREPLSVIMGRAAGQTLRAIPFVTLGTAIWVAIAWKWHQSILRAVTGAKRVERAQEPRLYQLLENLCISRGLSMPRLEILETDVLNAYASGLNPEQYTVTVTRGLMSALDDAEMEAVLAHELTHIRNGDVSLMVVAVVIAGAVSFFGEILFRGFTRMSWSSGGSSSSSSSSSSDKKGGGGALIAILLAVALVLVSWLLSQVIRFALSRTREYLADAGAVELTKNPDALISALRKIEGKGELPRVPSAVMEMCIDNPRSGFADLFATHPSIDDRVGALVSLAGGRDVPRPDALLDETIVTPLRGPA